MKNFETLLNTYEELFDNDTLFNFVDKEVKEAYLDSYINPSFQGWIYRIMLDENFWLMGAVSQGTSTTGEMEGNTICLAVLDAYSEFNDDIIQKDYLKDILNEEQQQELLNYLIENHSDNLEEDEEKILDNFAATYTIDFDGIFNNLFPEIYESEKENYSINMWEAYGRDQILEKIYNSIDEIRNNID